MNCSDLITTLTPVVREEGELLIIQPGIDIPFDIKRVYYIVKVPRMSRRGFHAHKTLRQVIIAINGTIEVILDDGLERNTFYLRTPNDMLNIPAGVWRELIFHDENSICLVLASDYYNEDDYIRNYNDFINYIKQHD